jgi:hypothetical protein
VYCSECILHASTDVYEKGKYIFQIGLHDNEIKRRIYSKYWVLKITYLNQEYQCDGEETGNLYGEE